jgi:hypothetical protein
MKNVLITLLCAAALLAQESVSRVVKLHHISAESTSNLLGVLSADKVRWRHDSKLGIVALHGPAGLVDAMEAAIQKLDVPPSPVKNIELTFHMLLASPAGEPAPVPAELTGVAQQLRTVFGLQSIRVLETAVLRARDESGADASGTMASLSRLETPATYSLHAQKILVAGGDKSSRVRIDTLRFNARFPIPTGNGFNYHEAHLKTDIDIREGQKVVVGKTSIDNASQSVFLVVTAKVVD